VRLLLELAADQANRTNYIDELEEYPRHLSAVGGRENEETGKAKEDFVFSHV